MMASVRQEGYQLPVEIPLPACLNAHKDSHVLPSTWEDLPLQSLLPLAAFVGEGKASTSPESFLTKAAASPSGSATQQ